ncbi:MAG: hypothetical protein U5R30_18115 [Deltaproteobacteria bacterium]|nr:hypothetical protein [Deltaproteobacteria bacterium]
MLDHIDLIAGDITGEVAFSASPVADTDYDTNAAVITTFERRGGAKKNGYLTYVFVVFKGRKIDVRSVSAARHQPAPGRSF